MVFVGQTLVLWGFFSARVDLQPSTNMWYDVVKDKIRQQQSKPVWVSEVTVRTHSSKERTIF